MSSSSDRSLVILFSMPRSQRICLDRLRPIPWMYWREYSTRLLLGISTPPTRAHLILRPPNCRKQMSPKKEGDQHITRNPSPPFGSGEKEMQHRSAQQIYRRMNWEFHKFSVTKRRKKKQIENPKIKTKEITLGGAGVEKERLLERERGFLVLQIRESEGARGVASAWAIFLLSIQKTKSEEQGQLQLER